MDLYDFFLISGGLIVLAGIVSGFGENRKIIVFSNYDDLGLTFLIPASYFLIQILTTYLGGSSFAGTIVGSVVALYLFALLTRNTYASNGQDIGRTVLALATKIPLAVVWVLALMQVLNPSGKGSQRTANRGQALIVLAVLTPIVGGLVVDKTGSMFNPKAWIKGRRVGSGIRDHM